MSVVGLGCVKTCAREEAAELFSLLSSPDGVHQRVYFSIDKIETNFLSANSISEFSHSVGHSRPARTGGGFGHVRSAPESDRTEYLLPAMRLRIRALPKPLHVSPPSEGRRSAERRKLHGPHQRVRRAPRRRMLPFARASGARAFRRSTAVLAAPDASGHRLSFSPALPETRLHRALPFAACLQSTALRGDRS